MKRTILYIILVLFVAVCSCTETAEGFLDPRGKESPDREAVFADSAYTVQFHVALYMQLGRVVSAPHTATSMLGDFKDYEQATNNSRHTFFSRAEYTPAFSKADFTQSGINANFSFFRITWEEMYQCIQRCNTFLKYYQNSPLSAQKKENLAAEARFLRAFYYFHLLRNYGSVPLLYDEVLDPFEKKFVPRADFEVLVDYLAEELSSLADFLPEEQNGIDYGRPTKASALALLGKLYVLAASPLHNGGNVGSGDNRKLTGYDDYSVTRWQKAADALKKVIDLKTHELVVDNETRPGYGFYLATTRRVSKERLWFWITTNLATYPQKHLLPPSRGGSVRAFPYHELTEAFPMKDGRPIDRSDLYDPVNPYDNRDPRFGYTILYNGSTWIKTLNGEQEPIYTYQRTPGDNNQDAVFASTPTGYYFRKGCLEEYLGGTPNAQAQGVAFIRYADVLLMYAEALTEIDVDANRNIIEEQLFAIRERAGIDAGDDGRYGIPGNLSKSDMIDLIMNERRIEFANEAGNWYFDLKRRKMFENLNGKWNSAAVWTKSGDLFTLKVQPVEQQFFDAPRMYFNAIPQREINASGNTLIQNPGW